MSQDCEDQLWDEKERARARELTTRDSVMAELAKQAWRHLQEHRATTGFDGLHEQLLGQMRGFGVGLVLSERMDEQRLARTAAAAAT